MAKVKKANSSRSNPRVSRSSREPIALGRALVEAFLTNERVNQVLLDLLDPKIWRIPPSCSKRRNIATSFAHIHNVRRMRLVISAGGSSLPKLDRAVVTVDEVREALTQTSMAMAHLIESSLETGGHVREYSPNVVALVCATINHEAHHRGQICHWARELGSPITTEQQLKLWEWSKLWQQVVSGVEVLES